MAIQRDASFSAVGSPDFVAAAALGSAIGGALRTQADFDNCMRAAGWVEADNAPVRPAVVTSAAPDYPVTVTSKDGKLEIVLRPGWIVAPPPANAGNPTIWSVNKEADSVVAVYDLPKADIGNITNYVTSTRDKQMTTLTNAVDTKISDVPVSGNPGHIYELTGDAKNGIRYHFGHAIIEMPTVIARLVMWTRESRYQSQLPDFGQMMRSLRETGN